MGFKNDIKHFLGRVRCLKNGVAYQKGLYIGGNVNIVGGSRIFLGEKVLLSPNVYITDCDHAFENIETPIIDQGIVNKEYSVLIGDHSYIGINTVIIGNVKIGKHCVIGANSVVTKDILDYCVAVGSPARVIKRYNFFSGKWENMKQ